MEDQTCDQTGQNSVGQEDQDRDTPEESNSLQFNGASARYHNPPAMANALPASAESSSWEIILVDRNYGNNGNGNNSLVSRDHLRYAAVGVATGVAAVVATPVVLSAAGFTTGGVAAGSIAASLQSVFYGGSVASGSAFALAQSAGAAGIGAAGNTAIGGIFGGIGALGAKMFDRFRRGIKLLICGWGSEARVFAAIASSVTGTEVRVLPTDRWSMLTNNFNVTFPHRRGGQPTRITSRARLVKHNPEDAMKDVDIVVFLPAFGHEDFLHDLRPYIKPGLIIAGLLGEPAFEFQVLDVLGDVAQQCTIMSFEASPWVCRNTEFGADCEVLRIEEALLGAIRRGRDAPRMDPVSTLQSLLGSPPKLIVPDHV